MIVHTPIVIITNDGGIKHFNSNQIGDARLYIEENGGQIFWRDDWYQNISRQLYRMKRELDRVRPGLNRKISK